MMMSARLRQLARGFDRLANTFRKPAPHPPAPVRHSLDPRFTTIREVIYSTWDMHEQAQVVVILVLDQSLGLHIHMANETTLVESPSLRARGLNLLTQAAGLIMSKEGGHG